MDDRSASALLQKSAGNLSIIGFGSALVYSTLAFGAATPSTRSTLDIILLAASLLGVFSIRKLGRRMRSMVVPIVLTSLILLQAAIAYSNPSHHYDVELNSLVAAEANVSWLPSSSDPASSLAEICHIVALLIALLVLTAMLRDKSRRWQLLTVIAICGVVVAIIGIMQKLVDAPSLLWVNKQYHEHQKTFFAAFRYHGHAAAFLNLCWPAALALFVRGMATPKTRWPRVVWGIALVLIIAALLFNTSKYGHVTVLPAIISAGWLFRHYYTRATSKSAITGKTIIIAVVAGAAIIAVLMPVATRSIDNWKWELEHRGSSGGRLVAYEVCIDMIESGGPFGFGAGTFHRLFPYYSAPYSGRISGVWIHAHQDYLQTVIEWGWLGALPWLALVGGAFYRQLYRPDRNTRPLTLSIAVSLVALSFLATHALIDFPMRIGVIQIVAVVYLAILWSSRRRA